jgi:alpha-D-ribose 1-methylphosphonate 5-triphosphate diphosphatase PhnM
VTPELASLSSDAAARFLGLRRGLAAGSRADLVQLRDDGSGSLGVHRVLRAGRWVATEPDRAGALGG